MAMMGLLSWISIGLVAGLLARLLLRGSRRLGLLLAMAIGLAGALLGGLAATQLGFGGLSGFDPRSLVVASLGAILCLLMLRLLRR